MRQSDREVVREASDRVFAALGILLPVIGTGNVKLMTEGERIRAIAWELRDLAIELDTVAGNEAWKGLGLAGGRGGKRK